MAKKKVNKSETLQKITEWGNSHYGHSINMGKLNAEMAKPNWEKTLIGIARFCGTEIVYH